MREKLTRRLQDGEPGGPLLAWLNALPTVQAVLAREFSGSPVSKQNLCEWRAGGFAEWQARQETLAQARELAADADEITAATDGRLTDHLATVLAMRYAAALAGWNGEVTEEFRRKLRALRGLCQDIVELRRGDHSGARLKMEQERLEREREKTEEVVVEHFQRWAKNPQVRDWICQAWVSAEERERRLREIFGLPPEPPQESASTVPESSPVKPSQTAFSRQLQRVRTEPRYSRAGNLRHLTRLGRTPPKMHGRVTPHSAGPACWRSVPPAIKPKTQNERINMMTKNNAVVAIYKSHTEAEAAVKELQSSGFDMKKLSIVGRDHHTDEHVVGYYNAGDRMKYWGKQGAFWGGIWGLLFGSAFFLIPGIGPLLVAGPLVGWIVGALEGAAVVGGLSALGAGLYSLGIPKDSILRYETALKTGKFVVIAHGTAEEAARARDIIRRTSPEALEEHQPARSSPEPHLVGA